MGVKRLRLQFKQDTQTPQNAFPNQDYCRERVMNIMMLDMLGIEFYFPMLDLAKIMNEHFASKSNFVRVQVGFNHKLRLGHVFY